MKSSTFYIVFGSFFAGVTTCSFFDVGLQIVAAVSIFLTILISAFAIIRPLRKTDIVFILIVTLSFSLGAFRIELARSGDHPLDAHVAKKTVTLFGFVCAEPEAKDFSEKICFSPQGIADRIEVTAGRLPGYVYGDILKITGRLELPKNFAPATDTPSFDYVSYLAKDHIRYVMFRPKIEKTGEGGGNTIIAALLRLKLNIISVTGRLLPEPQAALLAGILLGERRAIPQAIIDGFKRSGLIHVVILSGYSVTIVATSIMNALSFLPMAASRSLGALAIITFAIMTGASAMTVRASIMALIALGVRSLGRRYDAMRGLTIAAFLMVMQNPLILVYDAAFQISITSVVGIIYVSPILQERLGWVTERWGLREIICATASTQIFVMPLILYYMGQISVISIVPNILILPILPWTMFVGFVAITIGLVSSVCGPVAYIAGLVLAGPFALVARFALSYMLWIVSFFGGLSFSSIQTTISIWMLMVVYAIYISAIIFLRRRGKLRRNSLPPSAN